MAKKVDFGKVKEFMIAKGERAALGVCLLVGVGLLFMGVASGLSNSKRDWITPFKKGAEDVIERIRVAPKEQEGKGVGIIPIWNRYDVPLALPLTPLIPITEIARHRRLMPKALPVIARSNADEVEIFRHTHGFTVLSEHKDAQVDYLLAGLRTYEVLFEKEKYVKIVAPAGGGDRLSEALRPRRFVVVQLAYNMKKQLKEFADALGVSEKDLLASNDATLWPRVIGLDVIRYEAAPGAKKARETRLYEFQPHETHPARMYKVKPKPLDETFRTMLIETAQTQSLSEHLFVGLTSPLPELLTGPLDPPVEQKIKKDEDRSVRYPKVRLEGIKQNLDIVAGGPEAPPNPGGFGPKAPPGGGFKLPGPRGGKQGEDMPGVPEGGGVGGEAGTPQETPIKKLFTENQSLYYRVKTGYFPFDPYGEMPTGFGPDRGPGGPLMPGGPNLPGPGKPLMPGSAMGDPRKGGGRGPRGEGEGGRDAGEGRGPDDMLVGQVGQFDLPRLIRFIDLDVLPGNMYVYSVQVHLANPFYGRRDADAQEWSKERLLPKPSPPAFTPPITIPGEYFYYAVDVPAVVSDIPRGNDLPNAFGGVPLAKLAADQDKVPVQIHRWIGDLPKLFDEGRTHPVADWVVAERLLVRRGEIIGRRFNFDALKEKKTAPEPTPDAINVEVPEWYRTLGTNGMSWIRGKPVDDKLKKGQKVFKADGFPMKFQVSLYPPVLVDFEGGKRNEAKFNLKDDSAYDMLILESDGKLIVRSSARDTADAERLRRYEHWRIRVLQNRRDVGVGFEGDPEGGPGVPNPGGPRGG